MAGWMQTDVDTETLVQAPGGKFNQFCVFCRLTTDGHSDWDLSPGLPTWNRIASLTPAGQALGLGERQGLPPSRPPPPHTLEAPMSPQIRAPSLLTLLLLHLLLPLFLFPPSCLLPLHP